MLEENRKTWWLYSTIFLFVFVHLLYMNTPFVNFEWVYKVGTNYFLSHDIALQKEFFFHQANPITYSFVSSFFVYLFGDSYINYRIAALIGGTLILISLSKEKNIFLILMVALNPIFWIYSGRAYAELLSVGLMFLALDINGKGYLRGVLGGFAAAVKYHSFLFTGPYWGLKWLQSAWFKKSLNLKDFNFIALVTSIIVFIGFLLVNLGFYDIWVIPDKFKTTYSVNPSLNLSGFINNFFGYGFYISALFFITIPYVIKHSKLKSHLIAIFLSLALAFWNQDTGEMNFGLLDSLLGTEFILLIKVIGFWNFLLCLELFWKNKKSRLIVSTILIFLLILSSTRPAQRYLLYIIPFWALLIVYSKVHLHAFYRWGYILTISVLTLFSTLYQVSTANASKEVISWSQNKNMQIDTYEIYAHVGDAENHTVDSDFIVVLNKGQNQEELHKVPVKIMGFTLTEYIVVRKNEK